MQLCLLRRVGRRSLLFPRNRVAARLSCRRLLCLVLPQLSAQLGCSGARVLLPQRQRLLGRRLKSPGMCWGNSNVEVHIKVAPLWGTFFHWHRSVFWFMVATNLSKLGRASGDKFKTHSQPVMRVNCLWSMCALFGRYGSCSGNSYLWLRAQLCHLLPTLLPLPRCLVLHWGRLELVKVAVVHAAGRCHRCVIHLATLRRQ